MGLRRAWERRFSPFHEIGRAIWQNKDNLPYAWRVLNKGVCDGCALGTSGLKDWTLPGTHLCWIRLNLLRLNTMKAAKTSHLAITDLEQMGETELRNLGRIDRPYLRRGKGPLLPLSWEDAMNLMVERFKRIDPQRMGFYVVSRGTVNESYYAIQRAVRALGCSNIDNSARICHAPSTVGLKKTTGFAATTCSYKDLIGSDWLVFFGSNAANNQPVLMKYLHLARKQGTKIAVVNPYREPGMEKYWVPSSVESALFGTKIADDFFQIKPGGDRALILATLKICVEENPDVLDQAFIQSRTEGWQEFVDYLASLDLSKLLEQTGLTEPKVRQFAELYSRAKSGVLIWSMGITMHAFGVENVCAIADLALAKGWVGKPKCGLMPIRGHSGVQGGAEMGAVPNHFPGGKSLNEASAEFFEQHWGFKPGLQKGKYISQMLSQALEHKMDALYCIGSNLKRVLPDSEKVRQALISIPFRVHHDIVFNRQMFVPSEEVLILPSTTRYEMEGGNTETSTERRIIFNPKIEGHRIENARDEWRVIQELARQIKPDLQDHLNFQSTDEIRSEIGQTVQAYAGIENLKKQGDFLQYGGPYLGAEGFATASQKARFVKVGFQSKSLEDGQFWLSSRRGKQFNSMHFVARDNLAGAHRDEVLMSPKDLQKLGMKVGDKVLLRNERGTFQAKVCAADMRSGSIMAYWPEINHLIPSGAEDEECGMVPFRETSVWVEAIK